MRGVILVGLVELVAGCQSILGIGDLKVAGDDSPKPDAPADALVFGDGPNCFGHGIVRPCLAATPAMPFMAMGNALIDTDADPRCQSVPGIDGCIVAVTTMNVAPNSLLRAQGRRPLLVVATGAIVLDGRLDVSSRAGAPGAGANGPQCVAPGPPGNTGGAAGGSFGGTGGGGGGGGGASGGGIPAPPQPLALRGGCPGGSAVGALGGLGGGAVYLISRTQITVNVSINASGGGGGISGGGGGGGTSGGGGGGSGGLIALDAPKIDGAGELFANGGGGGGSSSPFQPATPGTESPNAGTPGAGGTGDGPGGGGSVGSLLDGVGGKDGLQSGGGGGGGGGLIAYAGMFMLAGKVSPPAVVQH